MNLDKQLSNTEQNFGKIKNKNNNSILLSNIDLWTLFKTQFDRGTLVEIYGKEGVGKSTLALALIKDLQKKYNIILIDADHKFDTSYAKTIGVDTENFLIIESDSQIKVSTIIRNLINEKIDVDIIILDSLAMIDSEDYNEIIKQVQKSNICFIFLNQIRETMKGSTFSLGSRNLKVNTSIRIKLLKKSVIKVQEDIVGLSIIAKTIKNTRSYYSNNVEIRIPYAESCGNKRSQ